MCVRLYLHISNVSKYDNTVFLFTLLSPLHSDLFLQGTMVLSYYMDGVLHDAFILTSRVLEWRSKCIVCYLIAIKSYLTGRNFA